MDTPVVSIFKYRSDSYPSKWWVFLVCILIVLTVILHQGVGVPDIGLFTPIYWVKHDGEFNLDPLTSVFYPRSYPLFFRPLADFFDIPIWHLVFGVCVKALIVVLYFYLARILTGSIFASLLAVAILFGIAVFHVGEYDILNLKLPVGFASFEFRESFYMSFRQVSAAFGLLGAILFIKKKYVLSSVALGVGANFHSLNCLNFFANFFLVLLVYSLIGKNRLKYVWSLLRFSTPFILILVPYLIFVGGMFPDVEPMNYPEFAKIMMLNEPDDFSFTWVAAYFRVIFFISFVLTITAGLIHLVFLSNKPLRVTCVKSIFEKKDMVISLLLAPWIIFIVGIIWENLLAQYLPAFINDFFTQLSLRRITSFAAIFYIIVLSAFLSNVVSSFVKLGVFEIWGSQSIGRGNEYLTRYGFRSLDTLLALSFSVFLLIYVAFIENANIGTFKRFLSSSHFTPEYFTPLSKGSHTFYMLSRDYVYYPLDPSLSGDSIPFEPFKEVCIWIKNNTPSHAGFFHPTYIKVFRLLSERQGFVSEKVDGNMAIYNRKFAKIFLERFSDINDGLTYNDFPLGEELYPFLRKKYLSLTKVKLDKLRAKYPGYDYFLTEKSHSLDYPLLFENEFFRLYNIK